MAYETGSATTTLDLLEKFRLFLIANGWTVNRNVAAGSGREVCVSKGTSYFNMRAYSNEAITVNGSSTAGKYGIALNGSDGYAGGSAWDRQPGYPLRTVSTGGDQAHATLEVVANTANFPSYFFFAEGDCAYLELEVTAGQYQRLGFGKLDLFAPVTGDGRFFYATNYTHPVLAGTTAWLTNDMDQINYSHECVPFRSASYNSQSKQGSSYLRAAFDSFNNWAGSARTAGFSETGQACIGSRSISFPIEDWAPSPLNGVGIIVPQTVGVLRGDTLINPVGVLPNIRYMDMTNYSPGAEFAFGGDTWKVFPWYQKGGVGGMRGIAYKKVI
jgi:hypothetical protein